MCFNPIVNRNQWPRIVCVLLLFHTAVSVVWPQVDSIPLRQPSEGHQRGDGKAIIKKLIQQELATPTDTSNVEQRYQMLNQCMGALKHSGVKLEEVFPRGEALELDRAMDNDDHQKAVHIISDTIARLMEWSPAGAAPITPDGAPEVPPPGNRLLQSATAGMGGGCPTPSIEKWSLYHRLHDNVFGNILKLSNPVIDSLNRKLYICGTKSTYLAIIDIDKDEVVDTLNMGVPGGFIIPDFPNDMLYLFDFESRYHEVNLATRETRLVKGLPSHIEMPSKGVPRTCGDFTYTGTGYPFRTNYLQKANAAYGIIHVKDNKGKVVTNILYGPNANFFEIDQPSRKLYSANTGDGSLTVYDIREKSHQPLQQIQVGLSIDEMVSFPEERLLILRNRLGGNMITLYDVKNRSLRVIPNENEQPDAGIGLWPTGMVMHKGHLYVLSHYAGRIDLVDLQSGSVNERIDLQLPAKPRTDNISCMVSDQARGRLYCAFPELGVISIVDADKRSLIQHIRIAEFDKEEANRRPGPGRIILAADEATGDFFVYIPMDRQLLKLEGMTGRVLTNRTVSVDIMDRNMLHCDGENANLFVGNLILDSRTLSIKGAFDLAGRVVGYDAVSTSRYVLVVEELGARKQQTLVEYTGTQARRFWRLPQALSISSEIVFDFERGIFYVAGFESSFVEVFKLSAGHQMSELGKSLHTLSPFGPDNKASDISRAPWPD